MAFSTELVSTDGQNTPSNGSPGDVSVSSTQPSNANAGLEQPTGTSTKRLACNACRGRKVRCDRQQPKCGRCKRVGDHCIYSGPSKPSVSKLDLSRILLTLHDRLGGLHLVYPILLTHANIAFTEQTEARLALGNPVVDSNQYKISLPNLGILATPTNADMLSEATPELCALQPSQVQDLLSSPVEATVASSVNMPIGTSEG